MTFTIITHVPHVLEQNKYFAYAPYVREMNIWEKYVDEFLIVAPIIEKEKTAIDIPYNLKKITFYKIDSISLLGLSAILNSILKIYKISWQIYKAMQQADHIHLRCPGNVGLIGCLVQVLFPHKKKTAKYAGNWDSKSKQPWTYNLQKWILSNTFLTKNMEVLVYGDWENQSKNIKPFFTATYSESEKEIVEKTDFSSGIAIIFVGSLVPGKNPMYAVKLAENLIKKGNKISLNIYGDGPERNSLEAYINENKLGDSVFLHGNQNQEVVKKGYQKSHFVILPSKSEGWPKAVAEGMFWGCVPLATKVSCVPFMLDYGNRGVLLEIDFEKDVTQIENLFLDQKSFFDKSNSSRIWSQQYTIDVFETEIKKLLGK